MSGEARKRSATRPILMGQATSQSAYCTAWVELMAGCVLSSLSLVIPFAFTSRLFVEGLAVGALKL